MAAQATAKIVIASAARLIAVRHFWRSRNKIAEISVPAWPIPIHHTKFVISQAQPAGLLLPQTPMPVETRYVSIARRSSRSELVIVMSIHHCFGVFFHSVTLLI